MGEETLLAFVGAVPDDAGLPSPAGDSVRGAACRGAWWKGKRKQGLEMLARVERRGREQLSCQNVEGSMKERKAGDGSWKRKGKYLGRTSKTKFSTQRFICFRGTEGPDKGQRRR